jgi:hypothetical protein
MANLDLDPIPLVGFVLFRRALTLVASLDRDVNNAGWHSRALRDYVMVV